MEKDTYMKEIINTFCTNSSAMDNVVKRVDGKVFKYYLYKVETKDNITEGVQYFLLNYIGDIIDNVEYANESLAYLSAILEESEVQLDEYSKVFIDDTAEGLEQSYYYFEKYIDKTESEVYNALYDGQYRGYYELYSTIIKEFCVYIEEIAKNTQ